MMVVVFNIFKSNKSWNQQVQGIPCKKAKTLEKKLRISSSYGKAARFRLIKLQDHKLSLSKTRVILEKIVIMFRENLSVSLPQESRLKT